MREEDSEDEQDATEPASRVPLMRGGSATSSSTSGKFGAEGRGYAVKAKVPDGDINIVQFSAPIFYAEEDEGTVKIDLMRLGSMRGVCSVLYSTMDGSATAPARYIASQGEVVFEDGQDSKTVAITIVDTPEWAPTLEFKLQLSQPLQCELGKYLSMCRVKIIDHDSFPSSKYEWELKHGAEGVERIAGFGLLVEYWRLMFGISGNTWRTLIILVLDQLENLYLFYTLYIGAYLVNVVFSDSEDTEERLFWHRGNSTTEKRLWTATAIGAFYILPLTVLHLWALVRLRLDLFGRSRMYLQRSLFRKYLNYTEQSRSKISASDMQTAVMCGAEQLADGYTSMTDMSKRLGKLVVMIYFILLENPSVAWCVIVMPCLMLLWSVFRNLVLEGPPESSESRREVTDLVADTCAKYRLIANYFQRPRMNDMFSQNIIALRQLELPEEAFELNNSYFFRWVGPVFVGMYVAMEAHLVLDKELELGTFLATISIFRDIAENFSDGHEIVMRVAGAVDPLRQFCVYLNSPTDLKAWKAAYLKRRAMTKEARQKTLLGSGSPNGWQDSQSSSTIYRTDLIPLSLNNLYFGFSPEKPLFSNINLQVPQGKMIAISGYHGSGKSTLLRLLAQEVFPTGGDLFVPTHLRILHVSQEAYLLKGSVWHNLTFGCHRIQDVDPDRVKSLLESLAIWDQLEPHIHADLERHREALADLADPSEGEEEGNGSGRACCRALFCMCSGCCQCCTVACKRAHDEDESGPPDWHLHTNYCTRLKIHLARALLMNPEVLVLQRPLHHYNEDEQRNVLRLLRGHVTGRGLHMPAASAKHRRPRTLFFTADAFDHIRDSDVAWRVHATQVEAFNLADESSRTKFKDLQAIWAQPRAASPNAPTSTDVSGA